jgi:hypothetical protein
MNQNTLQSSIDNISTAVALGLDVDAPSGLTMYLSYAEDQNESDVVYVRGYHASHESAINELLAFAFEVWDNDGADLAPWSDYTLSEELSDEDIAQARASWISDNTDDQILDNFFGADFWGVSILKIEKTHSRPFTRASSL